MEVTGPQLSPWDIKFSLSQTETCVYCTEEPRVRWLQACNSGRLWTGGIKSEHSVSQGPPTSREEKASRDSRMEENKREKQVGDCICYDQRRENANFPGIENQQTCPLSSPRQCRWSGDILLVDQGRSIWMHAPSVMNIHCQTGSPLSAQK